MRDNREMLARVEKVWESAQAAARASPRRQPTPERAKLVLRALWPARDALGQTQALRACPQLIRFVTGTEQPVLTPYSLKSGKS